MTSVIRCRLDYYFHTPHILAERAVLGESLTVEVAGAPVQIVMPKDWPMRRRDDGYDADEIQDPSDHAFLDDHVPQGTIEVLETKVSLEADVEAPPDLPEWDEDLLAWSARTLREHLPPARAGIRTFLDWVSVLSEQPRALPDLTGPVLMSSHTFEMATGRRFRGGLTEADPRAFPKPREHGVLTMAMFRRLPDMLGSAPPPGSKLLEQAEYAVHHAHPRDPTVATVLAAAACELRVGAVLRDTTPPERVAEVKKAMRRPRGGAKSLYGEVMMRALGTSLQGEDPELFGRLVSLIVARNRAIHRGVVPTLDEAAEHVDSARRIGRWLDGVRHPT